MNRGTRFDRNAQSHSASLRRGFSLVEILVVLIVLLIGILAVVRLFPYGFLSLQRTQELTNASALAQQQIADLRNQPEPPQTVTAGLPDENGDIHVVNNVRPDDLTNLWNSDLTLLNLGFTLPANYSGYYFSDVNRIRYIQNEIFRIPVATPNNVTSSSGSIYVLQYGPVYNQFHTDPQDSTQSLDSLQVNSTALTRIVETATTGLDGNLNVPDVHNSTEYAIDYTNNAIAFFPRIADPGYSKPYRDFTLNYTVYGLPNAAGPEQISQYTLQIRVKDVAPGTNIEPTWLNIFDANAADPSTSTVLEPAGTTIQMAQTAAQGGIITGSDEVSRKYRLVSPTPGTTPPWSKDPYEYAWYSANDTVYVNANPGILLFNPLGHVSFLNQNASDADAQSYINQQSLQARISYLTYDNHILRDDRNMPGSEPYRVKLSVPFVLSTGDTLSSKYNYAGILSDPSVDPGTDKSPDMVVVNMNTGQTVATISAGQSATSSLLNATLDAKNGIVSFPATTGNKKGVEDLGLQNAPLRVFYRADREWGMQIQKASAYYGQVTSLAGTTLTPTTYYANTQANNKAANPSPTRIYFAVSESDKTVNLGEVYFADTSTVAKDPTSYQHKTNLTFQINGNAQNYQNIGGTLYTWIDLKDQFPNALYLSDTPTGRAINYVQGASLKSRVIWRDGQNWRRLDNDTIMPPTGQ